MIETEETVSSTVGSGLKITCSKDELVQALGVVSRAVSMRTSVQILSGILLEPHESGLPQLEAVSTFAVERARLLETITRVARAASRDESRPVLPGILVQFTAGSLVMAATDSYRLAVKQTELEGTVPELEAIVPARALQELARIAGSGDEIEVGVHE